MFAPWPPLPGGMYEGTSETDSEFSESILFGASGSFAKLLFTCILLVCYTNVGIVVPFLVSDALGCTAVVGRATFCLKPYIFQNF